MRYNAEFAELVDVAALASTDGLPDLYRSAVAEGWIADERGAWLLRQFLATYFGRPESLSDITGYEAAVNGRGIPDLDLVESGKERATALARRGVAFARAALARLAAEYSEHPAVTAYVRIGLVDMDDDEVVYVGDVTFVSAHDGEPPYLGDVEQVTSGAVLSVESA